MGHARCCRARDVIQVLSHATVFVCPSIYEPLGIVNLEAMACATAVVASDVGGIPEVVVDGETGRSCTTTRPIRTAFEAGLADAVNALVADPALADGDGRGRPGAGVEVFGWDIAARRTLDIYESLVGAS